MIISVPHCASISCIFITNSSIYNGRTSLPCERTVMPRRHQERPHTSFNPKTSQKLSSVSVLKKALNQMTTSDLNS